MNPAQRVCYGFAQRIQHMERARALRATIYALLRPTLQIVRGTRPSAFGCASLIHTANAAGLGGKGRTRCWELLCVLRAPKIFKSKGSVPLPFALLS
jgi:hypothetical protein